MNNKGKLIAVLSGDGGCGDSVFGARLAQAMNVSVEGSSPETDEELEIILQGAPRRGPDGDAVLVAAGGREEAARGADIAVITARPDILSLKRALALTGKLKAAHFPVERIKAVLDTFGNPDPVPAERAGAYLGLEVIASMPFDPCWAAADGPPGEAFARGAAEAASKIAALLEDCAPGAAVPLDEAALSRLKSSIHRTIISELSGVRDLESARGPAAEIVHRELAAVPEAALPRDRRGAVAEEVLDRALGLGCLEEFMRDSSVTEIMVNGPGAIYVEIAGKLRRTAAAFGSAAELMTAIDRIVSRVGRRVDESSPLVDARLAGGSRVNAVIPPLALNGPVLTIRKFAKEKLTARDLISFGALSEEMAEFIRKCVAARKNIVVSGGTGTGKTTLLNVLSSFIPPDERIVTIEDSAELNLPQEHVVRLESRPASVEGSGEVPIRKLVMNALRMRPDRIIVGECRGGEALDMLQAMNTGHDGSMTTVHANSPKDAIARICTMAMMSGVELPERAVREQAASAVNVIIQLARFPDGSRKATRLAEVSGMKDGTVELKEVFRWP